MKQSPIIIIMTVVLLLVGCTKPETTLITSTATPTLTPVPTPMPECHKAGTLVTDEVLFADIGANHSIMVYLPPCYAEQPNATYSVLYWANGNFWWQQLYDTTDRLASQGDVP